MKLLNPAALVIVINPNSASSKVHLCLDPSWPVKDSMQSINHYFLPPIPHILLIKTNLLKSQIFILSMTGDIMNFYTQHHLNIDNMLFTSKNLKPGLVTTP